LTSGPADPASHPARARPRFRGQRRRLHARSTCWPAQCPPPV